MTPDTGSPAPQTDVNAGDKPTTEQSGSGRITEADDAEVMNHLGISPEVQAQIAPPAEPEAKEEVQAEAETPEAEAEPVAEETPETTEEESETEEEETEQEEKPQGRVDKRDKRISKLTRQKKEAQERAEKAETELEKIRVEAEKRETKQKEIDPVSEEQTELNGQLSQAESTIAWCEANQDGGTTKQGDKEVFMDADEVSKLKRFAEKEVLRLTPEIAIAKRDARQKFQAERTQADTVAKQNWPEMFDRSKEDYQVAQNLLQQFPEIARNPLANYAVGLAIEGIKSLQAREQAKTQPNGSKKHREISERAFEPRVPIAPHSATPPSRNERPSPTKKLAERYERLTQEGGRENLVAALEALDETQSKTTSGGHRLVET